jgi:hypothetical protein
MARRRRAGVLRRVLDLATRRDYDAKNVGERVFQRRDKGEAVLAPEVDVDDRYVWLQGAGGARRADDVVRNGRGIPPALKNLMERFRKIDVVVDDEHAPIHALRAELSIAHGMLHCVGLGTITRPSPARARRRGCGSRPLFRCPGARHIDRTAMLRHNLPHHRQSQADAETLGREQWLENPRQRRRACRGRCR